MRIAEVGLRTKRTGRPGRATRLRQGYGGQDDDSQGLKADPGLFWRFWRRHEKWAQFLVKIAQGGIMEEERVVNLREPFLHGAVRRELVATLYEGADDINIDSRSPDRSPATHAGITVYPTASPHVVFILTA